MRDLLFEGSGFVSMTFYGYCIFCFFEGPSYLFGCGELGWRV